MDLIDRMRRMMHQNPRRVMEISAKMRDGYRRAMHHENDYNPRTMRQLYKALMWADCYNDARAALDWKEKPGL